MQSDEVLTVTMHRGDRAAQRGALLRAIYGEQGQTPEASLLRTGEVAILFQVSRRTVISWARAGKLPHITTPGGHRRYRAVDVRDLLESATTLRAEDA